MEGAITLVLYIIDDRMRKLEIGGGMMAGGSSVTNDTPSPEIIALEKNLEGELREVAARVEVTLVFGGGGGVQVAKQVCRLLNRQYSRVTVTVVHQYCHLSTVCY